MYVSGGNLPKLVFPLQLEIVDKALSYLLIVYLYFDRTVNLLKVQGY